MLDPRGLPKQCVGNTTVPDSIPSVTNTAPYRSAAPSPYQQFSPQKYELQLKLGEKHLQLNDSATQRNNLSVFQNSTRPPRNGVPTGMKSAAGGSKIAAATSGNPKLMGITSTAPTLPSGNSDFTTAPSRTEGEDYVATMIPTRSAMLASDPILGGKVKLGVHEKMILSQSKNTVLLQKKSDFEKAMMRFTSEFNMVLSKNIRRSYRKFFDKIETLEKTDEKFEKKQGKYQTEQGIQTDESMSLETSIEQSMPLDQPIQLPEKSMLSYCSSSSSSSLNSGLGNSCSLSSSTLASVGENPIRDKLEKSAEKPFLSAQNSAINREKAEASDDTVLSDAGEKSLDKSIDERFAKPKRQLQRLSAKIGSSTIGNEKDSKFSPSHFCEMGSAKIGSSTIGHEKTSFHNLLSKDQFESKNILRSSTSCSSGTGYSGQAISFRHSINIPSSMSLSRPPLFEDRPALQNSDVRRNSIRLQPRYSEQFGNLERPVMVEEKRAGSLPPHDFLTNLPLTSSSVYTVSSVSSSAVNTTRHSRTGLGMNDSRQSTKDKDIEIQGMKDSFSRQSINRYSMREFDAFPTSLASTSSSTMECSFDKVTTTSFGDEKQSHTRCSRTPTGAISSGQSLINSFSRSNFSRSYEGGRYDGGRSAGTGSCSYHHGNDSFNEQSAYRPGHRNDQFPSSSNRFLDRSLSRNTETSRNTDASIDRSVTNHGRYNRSRRGSLLLGDSGGLFEPRSRISHG